MQLAETASQEQTCKCQCMHVKLVVNVILNRQVKIYHNMLSLLIFC